MLPFASAVGEGVGLSDRDLEAVTGGVDSSIGSTSDFCCGTYAPSSCSFPQEAAAHNKEAGTTSENSVKAKFAEFALCEVH